MWGSVFVSILLCITLCSFYFCNRPEEVENDVDLLMPSYRCLVNVNVLRLFITVRWVGLQCVSVVSPGHTHLRPCQC